MHVYNAIMVLQQILPIFPLASLSGIGGVEINRAMDRFIENEERGDLGILAKSSVYPCYCCPGAYWLQILSCSEETRSALESCCSTS